MNNYDDKTMLTDMLSSQKFIAQNYNSYAGEFASKPAKAKLMKILGEEHDIQFKIFEQMSAKGWYPTQSAPQDKIKQAVQQHVQAATNQTKSADKVRTKKSAPAKKTLSSAKTSKTAKPAKKK